MSVYESIGAAYVIFCTAVVTVCIAYFGWQGVKKSAELIDAGTEKQREDMIAANQRKVVGL